MWKKSIPLFWYNYLCCECESNARHLDGAGSIRQAAGDIFEPLAWLGLLITDAHPVDVKIVTQSSVNYYYYFNRSSSQRYDTIDTVLETFTSRSSLVTQTLLFLSFLSLISTGITLDYDMPTITHRLRDVNSWSYEDVSEEGRYGCQNQNKHRRDDDHDKDSGCVCVEVKEPVLPYAWEK